MLFLTGVVFLLSVGLTFGEDEEFKKQVESLTDSSLREAQREGILMREKRDAKQKNNKKDKKKKRSQAKRQKKQAKKQKKQRKDKKANRTKMMKSGQKQKRKQSKKGLKRKSSNKKKGKRRNKKQKKGNKKQGKGKKKRQSKRKNKARRKGNKKKGKQDKKKKQKKGNKLKNKERKRGEIRRTSRVQDDACVTDLANLSGVFGNQARNVFRQASRTATFSNQKNSKKGKKDDFNSPAAIVLSAVGGDASNPTCAGASNSTVSTTLSVLQNCSTSIESSCPPANQTLLDQVAACLTAADNYRSKFIDLFVVGTKTAAQICTGTKDADILALRDTVKGCVTVVKDAEQAQKREKQVCDTAFRSCRSEERNSISSVDTCKVTCPSETTAAPANLTTTAAATATNTTRTTPTRVSVTTAAANASSTAAAGSTTATAAPTNSRR